MGKKALGFLGASIAVFSLVIAFIMHRSDGGGRSIQKNIKFEYPEIVENGIRIDDGVIFGSYGMDGDITALTNEKTNRLELVKCAALHFSIKNNSPSNFHWNGFKKIYPITDENGVKYAHKEIGRYRGAKGDVFQNETAEVPPGAVLFGVIIFEPIPDDAGRLFLEFDLH